ncbi:uncharacterized protein LOC123894377 isoform X1 [Trifolium pratense]|uniref:uncharacterized protein LOC123894377 isoform X1 n=1 Tax=Trifolium pratense TaxID=57577 RepID=UPI001E6936E6|nr:uncharacterized protein LOC123894377 isoform X1 [Trifolium pratense]XP_045800316.1 uncharacterized protein LOC123894377 isoform X1 [Trifolium pratense]XP_045800317.1 uncharacterized protein LOC123894377 isoform X1 [Trifolium pratense]XP_045800318.1 uncharacterized protein LOC123894377 isoform X1 [Trifolium pratense]
MRSYQMQVDLLLEVLNIVSGFGPTSGSALTSHMDVDKGRLLNLYLLLIQEVDLVKDDIKIIDIPVHLVKVYSTMEFLYDVSVCVCIQQWSSFMTWVNSWKGGNIGTSFNT